MACKEKITINYYKIIKCLNYHPIFLLMIANKFNV